MLLSLPWNNGDGDDLIQSVNVALESLAWRLHWPRSLGVGLARGWKGRTRIWVLLQRRREGTASRRNSHRWKRCLEDLGGRLGQGYERLLGGDAGADRLPQKSNRFAELLDSTQHWGPTASKAWRRRVRRFADGDSSSTMIFHTWGVFQGLINKSWDF